MTQNFTDKDRLTDALNAQKYAAGHYSTFACETKTPEVRACVMKILNEECDMQNAVFNTMDQRGWYPTTTAEEQKLQQAKTKYASFAQ